MIGPSCGVIWADRPLLAHVLDMDEDDYLEGTMTEILPHLTCEEHGWILYNEDDEPMIEGVVPWDATRLFFVRTGPNPEDMGLTLVCSECYTDALAEELERSHAHVTELDKIAAAIEGDFEIGQLPSLARIMAASLLRKLARWIGER